jgi:hypothetical protein
LHFFFCALFSSAGCHGRYLLWPLCKPPDVLFRQSCPPPRPPAPFSPQQMR